MAKMYAWSKFKAEVNEWGQVTKWIMPGETVTRNDLKVSEEEWNDLVDAGVVREEEYPDLPPDVAPAEHFSTTASDEARIEYLNTGELSLGMAREAEAAKAPEADKGEKAK